MASTWRELGSRIGRIAVRQGPRIYRELQRSGAIDKAIGAARQVVGDRVPGGATTNRDTPSPRIEPRPVTSTAAPARERARRLEYAPDPDGRADPGEIVWTWVTYEEDASQGKDRPVLVVGRDATTLLGLMLSSNADRDGQHGWIALGAGTWDSEKRPSWVRLDRVLDVPEEGIRREGAVLDSARFDRVAHVLRSEYGWR